MIAKSLVEIVEPAPVLNTSHFQAAFGSSSGFDIPRNGDGHPKHIEFVALPGQLFTVEEIYPRHNHSIYRVSSPLYRSRDLFIDSRFVKPAESLIPRPHSTSFQREDLANQMKSLIGTKYVWGGNWSMGISRMLHYYPPQKDLDEEVRSLWTLKGVDCSGLLYEVTRGATPRNTEELILFGKPLPIEGKSSSSIIELLLPMDMVIWPGHVWFVLDASFSIESKAPFGVIQRPLLERLEETCKEREPFNEWPKDFDRDRCFTIRRFCTE